MTWVASQVVLRDPKLKDEFVPIVHQGVDFLANVMWDKQDGRIFLGTRRRREDRSAVHRWQESLWRGFLHLWRGGGVPGYGRSKGPGTGEERISVGR
jgi:hypothetical protein